MREIFSKINDKFLDLDKMIDVEVRIILLGDGMSGKTQLIISLSKIITEYLKNLYSLYLDKDNLLEERKKLQHGNYSPNYYKWVKIHGFNVRYGHDLWDLSTISLDTETIGLEDFSFIFPYFYKDITYRINLNGTDLGGQNIYDHFRAVLGKIARPNDNMIVVFDKSRNMSCKNSIRQFQEVIEEISSDNNIHMPKFWFISNKIDLEEHIKSQEWQMKISQSFINKLQESKSFCIPSLIFPEKEERLVRYKIENNMVSFPDVEALVYNSIRESDERYGNSLMSDVNARALAREVTAQLVYFQKSKYEGIDLQGQWWEDFMNLIYQQRPLALQYVKSIGIFQNIDCTDDSFNEVRVTWQDYKLHFQRIRETIQDAIKLVGETDLVIESIGKFFSTNAVEGKGIEELFNAIIQYCLQKEKDPSIKREIRCARGRIKRF